MSVIAVNRRRRGRPALDPDGVLDAVVWLLSRGRYRGKRERRTLRYAALAYVILDNAAAASREAGSADGQFHRLLGIDGFTRPALTVLAELGRLRDPDHILTAAHVAELTPAGDKGKVLCDHMAYRVRCMQWQEPPASQHMPLSDLLRDALPAFWRRHTEWPARMEDGYVY